MKELDYPRDKLQVTLHFYSVLKAVPERYHEAMIYIKKRCAFVRLFMPSNLPSEDAILYLDTDNIVTGNIKNVWDASRK
ncbi:Glucoside xylosyltransferase 1 [Orchesella cincta]|uniref:Glucoside xylosyltransferase 1 n=1 Tax=Orchesella cincta TaxID=48709 RepID=A0A1D2MG34_ORCCI|nr:Glucoside xylosyltransferase 1 [Orchesella cincta]